MHDPARDRDLVARVTQGEEGAFQELVRMYGPAANSLATRIVKNRALGEEVLQDAFLSLWNAPGGYRPELGSVRSWLMATVHHRAVDSVRRESAHRRRMNESAEMQPGSSEPDFSQAVVDDMARPEQQATVRRALDALPTDQRTVLEMMYFEARTQRQIAEELGVALGTIKSRCLLGMRKLRTALGGMDLERSLSL